MKIYLIILSILLISSISALSISPSSLSLNAYPGESVYRNITITTSGNQAVYLTSSHNNSITLNYTSPIIVEGNRTIPIQFVFKKDIFPKTYEINIEASTGYETVTTIIPPAPSSSGSLIYLLPNGSYSYKKFNITNSSIIVLKNTTIEDNPVKKVTVPLITKPVKTIDLSGVIYFIIFLGLGIGAFYLYKYLKQKRQDRINCKEVENGNKPNNIPTDLV